MAVDYWVEKFQRAVDVLADSIGSWRERLYDAFISMHAVQPNEDLPPELQQRGNDPFKMMSSIPAQQGEGNFRARINQMSDEEGRRTIHEIWAINDELQARHRD